MSRTAWVTAKGELGLEPVVKRGRNPMFSEDQVEQARALLY